MKCPACKKEIDVAVCPECHEPIKIRTGLVIPETNTLVEIPYSIGKLYARFYRLAFLPPNENQPMKLAFGCEERPLQFLKEKKEWFNPVMIDEDNLLKLKTINYSQIAGELALIAYYNEKKWENLILKQMENKYEKEYRSEEAKNEILNLALRFLTLLRQRTTFPITR